MCSVLRAVVSMFGADSELRLLFDSTSTGNWLPLAQTLSVAVECPCSTDWLTTISQVTKIDCWWEIHNFAKQIPDGCSHASSVPLFVPGQVK